MVNNIVNSWLFKYFADLCEMYNIQQIASIYVFKFLSNFINIVMIAIFCDSVNRVSKVLYNIQGVSQFSL